jgi:hypothetical protein
VSVSERRDRGEQEELEREETHSLVRFVPTKGLLAQRFQDRMRYKSEG